MEKIEVLQERFFGKFMSVIMLKNNTYMTYVGKPSEINKFNRNDQKDLETLWYLASVKKI